MRRYFLEDLEVDGSSTEIGREVADSFDHGNESSCSLKIRISFIAEQP